MNQSRSTSETYAPDPGTVAIHVLYKLTRAQQRHRPVRLDELATALGVRRPELRRVISSLHREGYVDAARMRVTLAGFAIGQSLRATELAPLRPVIDRAAAMARQAA